jgi:hypothetical protein
MPLRPKAIMVSQRFKYQRYNLSEAFPECRDKSCPGVFVAKEGFKSGYIYEEVMEYRTTLFIPTSLPNFRFFNIRWINPASF